MLVFDDLQRADAQTLHLLIFLAKQLARQSHSARRHVSTVDATSEAPELLARLTREDPTRCIELSGLTRDDVARYASIAVGATPPESAVDALYGQTAGNPLFCAQVIRGLRIDAHEDGAPDWGGLIASRKASACARPSIDTWRCSRRSAASCCAAPRSRAGSSTST